MKPELATPDNVMVAYSTKGQLNSEWIYDNIVSPKIPTKNFKDVCPGTLLKVLVGILVFWKK